MDEERHRETCGPRSINPRCLTGSCHLCSTRPHSGESTTKQCPRIRDGIAYVVENGAPTWYRATRNPVPLRRVIMSGQGSAGNIIAALCSFFIPGLGQLLQGRLLMAIVQFCLAAILWFFLLGWIIHLWSILDAALFKPRN